MQQVALIQSGCQQWIRQPAAIHGDQFAFTSSLAVFVHASEDYKLLKILAQHTQHLNAVCWSPVDVNLLACSTAEKVIRVYHLETDAALYNSHFPTNDTISTLCWSMHDESMLLAAAGSTIACWPYKSTTNWRTLHSFRSPITCMQQSATEPRLLAVGCADCCLQLFDMLSHKVLCTHQLDDGAVPCSLQFDPLSKSYLLVLCSNGITALYGISDEQNSLSQVSSLAKQPAGQRSAVFVPNAPGNFATISAKSGTMQLWNVSQSQPLHSLKTGKGPAQSIGFFPGSSRALITFQDGTVMVYDVDAQEQLWCTQPGHTETIFGCCFAPSTSTPLLATCSYDGTVRVWDIASSTCVKTMDSEVHGHRDLPTMKGVPGNALYSVTWSPDGSQLAASSASGAVYLFDYAKGLAVKKWQLHSKPSLKVAWHHTQSTLLASSSLDGSVVAFQTDGTKVKVLKHSSAVSGLAWSTAGYKLATTSESGALYVWDLNLQGNDCLLCTLAGHAKRSFSVLWSPLLPELLLSGSDDATARVWDVSRGACVALLSGHRSEVRALCWHSELPWLVFTGSWDSTIRCWDWRHQACVYECTQHHSDVYGLSIHSTCPWLLASASRDTTLRLWDIRGLVAGLMTRCFLEGAVPRGQATEHRQHIDLTLCGAASQQLGDWCRSHTQLDGAGRPCRPRDLTPATCMELFQQVSAFCSPPGPAQGLWQQAAAVAAHLADKDVHAAGAPAGPEQAAPTLAPARSSTASRLGQLLEEHITASGSISLSGGGSSCCCLGQGCLCYLQKVKSGIVSAANQLELSVRSKGLGRACMGAVRREEVLQAAAVMHLQAGNVERCCELLVEVGAWDKALALAPAVSTSYWRQLLQRKTDTAAKAGAPVKELLPQLLATGQVTALVDLLLRQKQYELAVNIASVAACGGYQHLSCSNFEVKPASSLPMRNNSSTPPANSPPPASQVVGDSSPAGMSPPMLLPHLQDSNLSSGAFAKRNSLPPIRASGLNSSLAGGPDGPGSPAGSPLGISSAGHGNSQLLGPVRAGSTKLGALEGVPSPPGSPTQLPAMAVVGEGAGSASASCMSSRVCDSSEAGIDRQLKHQGTSLWRGRSGTCAGSVMAQLDPPAWAQLATVCQTRLRLLSSQGKPIQAAQAALMVNDVTAAITALHLGHEPEQAAMVCLALGGLGQAATALTDRVFEALALKCEAAGDWWSAALALEHLSKDVQHHKQLLVVRAEHSSSRASEGAAGQEGVPAQQPREDAGPCGVLRQRLKLPSVQYCASMASTMSDALDSVRYLLLGHQHAPAAAKAIMNMQPLLQALLQHILQSCPSTNSSQTGSTHSGSAAGLSNGSMTPAQQLLALQAVVQLSRWQACLESLDATVLTPPCWEEVFANILLAGALKAFAFEYTTVGSYLMGRLRRWLEQHQLEFTLCRAALLLLEAELIRDSHPDAACSLCIAASDSAEAPADIKSAAREKLQAWQAASLGTATTSGADQSGLTEVIVAGSCLPHRPPSTTIRRSSVSGKQLLSGPWATLDDECSLVSLNEAVMLSHVMRSGPHGTGKTVLLLV